MMTIDQFVIQLGLWRSHFQGFAFERFIGDVAVTPLNWWWSALDPGLAVPVVGGVAFALFIILTPAALLACAIWFVACFAVLYVESSVLYGLIDATVAFATHAMPIAWTIYTALNGIR